ncbi:hypothetical protein PR048_011044 [Dryococelus australis]|uniref:Uncharacterized protein n=1 Tax=Dryococelus australis TaxID=614101 RepID=A0ABQ9HKG8_9NEOP|nr:hypothetical protein PR048_011044 [Dryococelus australis]
MLEDRTIRDLKYWITLKTFRDRMYIELINVLNKNIIPAINPMVPMSHHFMMKAYFSYLHMKPYSVQVQDNNVLMQFEIDSGCSRTLINLDTY